jgi:putative OPT family oligopeptide transporter
MSSPVTELPPKKKHAPYVPETMDMKEFTLRAVLIGVVLTVVLGSANAYLGLRAGMTIAATYPAAVIGMALLRLMKGSLLEENIARTIGTIGESVAAGAVFTIPAFVMAGLWEGGLTPDKYWKSAALMIIGGTLGVLFVTLLRRVMVEDPELPYPESVAAAEIHKAGQQGAKAAKILFANMGFGAFMFLLGQLNIFSYSNTFHVKIAELGKKLLLRTGTNPSVTTTVTGGATLFNAPDISPAYLGVGYIIGPRLGALNFAGGVLAWGLLVPILTFIAGPYIQAAQPGKPLEWDLLAGAIYYSIVRPIAVGGMLVGASYTLFKMRKQLAIGIGRAVSDLKKSAAAQAATNRTERDLSSKFVFAGIAITFVAMFLLYRFFISGAGNLAGSKVISAALVAAGVMVIVGFFFAAVSGNLVGMIGSSNNPVSGLTLCTLVIAALLMVALGVSGSGGVAAVLGVAAVVCVSSAVAGELLQDLKVGHILGGTPAKMEIGDLIGIVVAGMVLFLPLALMDRVWHFGSTKLPAPQAGLMAMLSKGIVGGDMAWPLVIVGIFLGLAMIMIEVKSVMLFSIGMYLPLGTTFAIFVGGIIRWMTDRLRDRRNLNDAQKARVENAGILTASGLIAGEALCGIAVAAVLARKLHYDPDALPQLYQFASGNHLITAVIALAVLVAVMVWVPLANAGRPEDPAPPTAIM